MKLTDELNTTRPILLGVLFWTGVWLFYVFFFSYQSPNMLYATSLASFILPIAIATSYFVKQRLIPRYLMLRKYKLFALYGFYTLVFSTHSIVLSVYGAFILHSNMQISQIPPMSRNFIFVSILVYLVVALVGFTHLLKFNFQEKSLNESLKNEVLQKQLLLKQQEFAFLKSQIHPHFLFNTLNTIYGLTLKNEDTAPDVILKLSNLLDYILYQVKKPLVPINDEINHIRDYIDLEKYRFRDALQVNLVQDIDDEKKTIPPMLLLPFIENAFKHGGQVNQVLSIDIEIILQGKDLDFRVSNSTSHSPKEAGGIGHDNLLKRLQILYPDQHSIDIKKSDHQYSIHLSIQEI